jgi:excisionase family DNA binding protein
MDTLAAAEPEFLTVSEVAARLRVSAPTVYRCVHDGTLPAVRLSEHGAIRIPCRALEFSAGRAADRTSQPAVEPLAHDRGPREEA